MIHCHCTWIWWQVCDAIVVTLLCSDGMSIDSLLWLFEDSEEATRYNTYRKAAFKSNVL